MGRKTKDLTGQKFGNLTAIKRVEDKVYPSGEHSVMWLCECECGNTKIISRAALINGKTKSCGCLKGESHKMSDTRLYEIWRSIKRRCEDDRRKDYLIYGGRGIKICKEWGNSFNAFYNWAINNGYNDTLTIERKDVNGNYEPSNCRWATKEEQANNRRDNQFLTHNGKTQTISQWAKELNINESTLRNRIQRGWADEEIFKKSAQSTHYITFNGETKSLRQWSICTGISYSTLQSRLHRFNWDVEKAFTIPSNNIKKRGE